MPDMNQREYQSVILGALLHDVGKFYHRTKKDWHEKSFGLGKYEIIKE
jgi:metal-dependent HD superfamily phosphatase/phosphodiesterase